MLKSCLNAICRLLLIYRGNVNEGADELGDEQAQQDTVPEISKSSTADTCSLSCLQESSLVSDLEISSFEVSSLSLSRQDSATSRTSFGSFGLGSRRSSRSSRSNRTDVPESPHIVQENETLALLTQDCVSSELMFHRRMSRSLHPSPEELAYLEGLTNDDVWSSVYGDTYQDMPKDDDIFKLED
jgi:hypothetical protein